MTCICYIAQLWLMQKLNQSKAYRTFVNDRDNALELILNNSRRRIAEKMNVAFVRVIEIVHSRYPGINTFGLNSPKAKIHNLELEIQHLFEILAIDIYKELVALRKKSYMLSFLGEHQAIGQSSNKIPSPELNHQELDNKAMSARFPGDVDPLRKISYELSKVKHKIINAVELSAMMDEDVQKAIGRVYLAFPKKQRIPKKAILKRVKVTEADYDGSDSIVFNLGDRQKSWGWQLDPSTWDQLVQDYKEEYIPVDRSPDNVFDIQNPWSDEPMRDEIPPEDAFYGWEVERDITHDFVQQVRDGQIDAANQNGIDEFVVISIIDDRTCESCCGGVGCVDFHGKLTSEVEQMTDGEYSAPPYHFNCRCSLAPASKDLEAVDTSASEKDFDQWLNQ